MEKYNNWTTVKILVVGVAIGKLLSAITVAIARDQGLAGVLIFLSGVIYLAVAYAVDIFLEDKVN